MVGIIQWVGDLFNVASTYTGADREIRIDTSNYDIRLHDGVTPGGHRIMNETNADAKYQLANPEISGIGPYAHDARGFLTRRGDGDYVIRTLVQDDDAETVITYPDGYSGNPKIALADSFTRAKTFGGASTFNAAVDGSGTFNINLDTSGKTVNFDANQIPVAAINSTQLTAFIISVLGSAAVPIGAIFLWNHTKGAIPTGYQICDGTNGTIDLRDKFVAGAGSAYAAGATGGATTGTPTINGTSLTTAQLAVHAHGVSDPTHTHVTTDPGHAHSLSVGGYFVPAQSGTGVNLGGTGGQFTPMAITANTNTTGITNVANSTGVTIQNSGNGDPHTHTANAMSILPPYYAEYFIQRVS